MTKLFTIHNGPGIKIRALSVPGGLLIITDTFEESGNGIAVGLATTFVPMPDEDQVAFLPGEDEK